MAINWSATRWLTAGFMFVALFVLAAVMMGIILAVSSNAVFCGEFNTADDGKGFNKVKDTTLYPYSGEWDSSEFGKTLQECRDTCTADPSCQGFVHHNANSTVDQDTCRYYTGNHAQALVGSNVQLSQFFDTATLIAGAQLPEQHTDVYLKTATPWNMFRSGFNEPTLT
jgi:hypothetical protein